MTLAETAFAKINLALHVRRRRADGYHDIETIFAFADFGDELTAAPAERLSLSISGRFGEDLSADADNLVLRAAAALAARFGIRQGAALHLDKRLPVAAGIGGGSADAAAALRLLARLWSVETDESVLTGLAAELGADVPACVYSRTARGGGVGTNLALVDPAGLAGLHVLLVNPLLPVATGPVFAGWDAVDRGALADLPPLAAALAGRNDLEAPALKMCPVIADVLAALRNQADARLVRMSGSGATCFALFDTAQQTGRAAAAVAAAHPGWWSASGKLR